jgi:hypothetical protein|tara:strand:- start:115 stop:360 length:246 start_codon:yes stop_codon:yes gene_type:complete
MIWIYLILSYGLLIGIVVYLARKNAKMKVEVSFLREEMLKILRAANIERKVKRNYVEFFKETNGRDINADDINRLFNSRKS